MGRELGWADGRDSGKPLLSLSEKGEAKAQSPSHPYTLPRAQDPGPVSKNLSRNHKALSMRVCGKAGWCRTLLGY